MTLEKWLRAAEVGLGLATLAFVAYLFHGLVRPGERATVLPGITAAPPPPLVLTLADSQVVDLHAGEHFDTTFVVQDPRPCVFTGRVLGLRGGSRDVEVLLLDREGATDWHDGIAPAALFRSGRSSSTTLRVPLPAPGEYTFLVSNEFSILRGKKVLIRDARVTCE